MTEQTEQNTKKLSKKDLLAAFKRDVAAADTSRLELAAKVDAWKKIYDGSPYGNEQEGKSKLVSKDVKRQDEWQHASVKDPFVSDKDIIKCEPITFEDRAAARQNELILNYQFTRKFNRYKFITDVVKLYYSEGTVVVKTSWDYEDTTEEVQMPVMGLDPFTGQPVQVDTKLVKQIKVLVNKPYAEICRIKDVYMDPTAMGDVTKAKFFCHRYETDLSTLKASGKYKNLDKVALTMAKDAGDDYDEEDDTEFVFNDQARKKILAYEYWGYFDVNNDGIAEPIVAAWIGDTLIQLQENPYPDKEIPFLVLANNSTPFQLTGEAAAELVGDNQQITTAIKRGILDNMANSNNAQKGIRIGALSQRNKLRFLNGKNFEFNGSANDFYEGSYNQIPGSVFSVLEMVNNETESMLGVKSFSGGINGAGLGSTATSARGALDAVSVRRLDIVRNISENLIKPLMRKWMSYNSEFLEEHEVVRITNDEFVQIARDDLKGNIDIDIQVSTAEDNSMKSERLSFLLQTLGQTLDQDMRNLIMIEIARLDKMPDLAKKIEEYEPKPDPMAEEFRKWELRKLQSEVLERESRAQENQVDMRAKTARAVLDEAKAREVGANTDLKDLDFVRRAEGKEAQERMAEKDHDRQTTMSKAIEDNVSKETINAQRLTKQ